MDPEVIIIGAGVSGLECARTLQRAGFSVLVLERSRGVGGRCATRRIDGQAVDHGGGFFHGDDPEFLATLRASNPNDAIDGWPRRIEGGGTPCQPHAFAPEQKRLAFRSGMTRFAKHLADDLSIELSTKIESLESDGETVRICCDGGREYRARRVVLAMAAAQARRLLHPLAETSIELRSIDRLLQMVGSVSCLTAIAGYGDEASPPDWDVWYPEQSRLIQMISHDSAKRGAGARLTLVYQALPAWSRRHWDDDPTSCARALLDEAAHLIGAWAGAPSYVRPHRWRYCRADTADEFVRPLLVTAPRGAQIGIAGEIFAPGGGVQAAWRSGRLLAERLLHEVHA